MKICAKLELPFVIPTFIMQDASDAEFNAAKSVFGHTVKILMCWFHMIYNIKKHASVKKLGQDLRDMVVIDLTRLHYCLEYEYEPYKAIVLAKWSKHADLADFVAYVIPQWFEGPFSNWQIFKSPPGFAATNNPLESFNKIIKDQFTNYDEQPLLAFIGIVITHLIPFYSRSEKEFLFYRIPHKRCKAIATQMDTLKFSMEGFIQCTYKGLIHTHTIDFNLKSCSCRWFWSFAVCAHLVAACDFYNYELKGYTKPKIFLVRKKRGVPKKALTWSERAFRENPMPIIAIPHREDHRSDLYLTNVDNMPCLPTLNSDVVPVEPEMTVVPKPKRAYNKKKPVEPVVVPKPVPTKPVVVTDRILRKRDMPVDKVRRLKKAVVSPVVSPKKGRGRPKKNGPALSI